MAALDDVNRLLGDLHRHIATFDNRLAGEARMQGKAGGHIQQIVLTLFRFRKVVVAFLDDDVARGAGTVAAAGVFDVDTVCERDIEQAAWLAVVVVRVLLGINFDGFGLAGFFVVEGDVEHVA